MNQVKAKVCYDIATGETLLITPEGSGGIAQTTKSEDLKIYPELKNKNENDIDFVELEFGTLEAIFNNSKGYRVDTTKRKFIVDYYTPEELQAIKDQHEATQNLNYRVSDISDYLNQQSPETIADFENYILQNELNKIMEGMN